VVTAGLGREWEPSHLREAYLTHLAQGGAGDASALPTLTLSVCPLYPLRIPGGGKKPKEAPRVHVPLLLGGDPSAECDTGRFAQVNLWVLSTQRPNLTTALTLTQEE